MPVTSTQINNTNKFFNKALLRVASAPAVFEQFALKAPVKGHKTVTFTRVNDIPVGTPTPLVEGANPTPLNTSQNQVDAIIQWYGQYIQITHEAEVLDPIGMIKNGYIKRVGKHAQGTRETLMRDALISGASSVYYAGGVAGRSNVSAGISVDDLDAINESLRDAGAEYITEIVAGKDRVNTYPVAECYILVVDVATGSAIRKLAGFTKVAQYSEPTVRFVGEIGEIAGFRVIESRAYINPLTVSGAGQDGIDVHRAIAFGKEAYGIADLETLRSITKTKKEAGGALERFSTTGYTMASASKVLNGDWCTVYECA